MLSTSKIKRDFDIVLLDDEYPLSKRNLCLPSGRLREGMRAIQRANFVLFTRDKQTENVSLKKKLEKWKIPYSSVKFNMSKPINAATAKEIDKNEDFSLIVGIAKPEQVIKQLIKWHFHPIRSFILSDHGEIPLKQVQTELQKGRKIVTTEKITTAIKTSLIQ